MKKKTLTVLIIIAAVAVLATSIGLTAALWTDAGGESGIAPQATVYDWNAWDKYVEVSFVNSNWAKNGSGNWVWNNGSGTPSDYQVNITGIKNFLGEEFVVPRTVSLTVYEGGSAVSRVCPVVRIKSTVFSSVTMKALPTSIIVPDNVTQIEASAFAGLTNLRKVVFAGKYTAPGTVTVNSYAFSGCTSLTDVVYLAGQDSDGHNIVTNVAFLANCFAGCSSLTSFSAPSGTVSFGGTNLSSSNKAAFLTYVGAPSTATVATA